MDKFPTGAGRGLRAICGDPMSWAAEAPELLDVEMEHVARLGMLITHDGGCGPEGRQVVEASPLEPAGDGAVANSTLLADLAIGLAATRRCAIT